MKKLIISVFMVTSLCLVTVGFVRTVAAQEGPTITKERTVGDLVIETKLTVPTVYEFEITYDNDGDTTDVIIVDTVPAEWNVTMIEGTTIDPFRDANNPNTGISDDDGGSGMVDVFRTGRGNKGNGKNKNSATRIEWIPDPSIEVSNITVKVETRRSPSGKLKYAPTSCGLLLLNDGAIAFEYDPGTGEIVLDDEGLPVEVAEPTDPLKLVAVEDLDGIEGVRADGDGDEDEDGLFDGDEVLIHGTDPCSSDTDGDGLTDDVEVVSCTDPTNADTDNDGLSDGVETDTGTDPCDADSDDDGCDDGVDPNPVTFSPDNDGDTLGADCDPDDNDDTVQ